MTWMLFDYGVGNLHSLRKALDAAGADTAVTTRGADLEDATVAVLPGVGAFGHVMDALDASGASDVLRARHDAGRPILGVCIGQQVLYEGSAESPGVPGLGILPGHVERLPRDAGKVPHMGWNTLDNAADPALAGVDGRHVYYVHTYAAPPGPEATATTTYGMTYAAAVRSGQTLGFQFHPEKSSAVGADILKRVVQAWEAP